MMELLERYLFAVSQQLPPQMREDVMAELRSLLLDMIENKGDVGDDTAVVAILQEFGSPSAVAASYRPRPQYLIGPDFYPVYLKIVQIVTGAMSIAFLVLFIISLVSEGQSWLVLGQVFVDLFPNYISSLLTGVGVVTVIFVLLERYAPDTAVSLNAELASEEAEWDPRQLPPINQDNQLDRPDLITEITFPSLATAFVNWFVLQDGVLVFDSETWHSLPILTDNFYRIILPLLNVAWISQILFNLYLLRLNEWTRPARWLEVAVLSLDLVVVGVIIANLPFIALNPALLTDAGWSADPAQLEGFSNLVTLFNQGLWIGLVVYAGWLVFSLGKRLYTLLGRAQTGTPTAILV
jgi:hypothetical protein